MITTHSPSTELPFPINTGELYDPKLPETNIGLSEWDTTPGAEILSNFALTSFVLDGVEYPNYEAFVQSLKASSLDEAKFIATMGPREAKMYGKRPEFQDDPNLYYHYNQRKEGNLETTVLPRNSEVTYALMERALEAKFAQNPVALNALLMRNGKPDMSKITHELHWKNGRQITENPKTIMPATIFCDMLMRIRQKAQNNLLND
ncbi:MAG: hypothetical protein QG570_294 [Patescibacteria group bacterium]|nr:hypothetical protein [Patescibacteria group bacterium]